MCATARTLNSNRITVMVLIPQHIPNHFVMTHDAIWKPDGVYKKLSGFITALEFIRAATEVRLDQRFDDVAHIIKDLSEVTGHEITEDTITDLGVIHCGFQPINPNCRIVFVTPDENLAKAIKNTLVSPSLASYLVEIKSTIYDARDWLVCQPRLQRVARVKRARIW